MPIEVKELLDVDVRERSLVGKPANRRPFICFKSEEGEPVAEEHKWDKDAQEHLDTALNTPVENEDEIVEKAASAKAKNGIRGALRLLGSIRDEVPEDVFKQLAAIAGLKYEPPSKAKKAPAKTDAKKEAEKPEAATESEPTTPPPEKKKGNGNGDAHIPDMVMAVAKAADPKETAAILAAYQAAPELIGDLIIPMLVQKDARIGELQETVKPLLKREEDRIVNDIVDALEFTGDREKHVAFIQTLSAEQRADYIEAHKSASEVGKSAMKSLTKPQGSDADAPPSEDTAMAEATRRAKAEMSKSDEAGDLQTAIYQAFLADPDLYEKHCHETAGRE